MLEYPSSTLISTQPIERISNLWEGHISLRSEETTFRFMNQMRSFAFIWGFITHEFLMKSWVWKTVLFYTSMRTSARVFHFAMPSDTVEWNWSVNLSLLHSKAEAKCEVLQCYERILVGLDNCASSGFKEIYKACKTCLSGKSYAVRCAAAKVC